MHHRSVLGGFAGHGIGLERGRAILVGGRAGCPTFQSGIRDRNVDKFGHPHGPGYGAASREWVNSMVWAGRAPLFGARMITPNPATDPRRFV